MSSLSWAGRPELTPVSLGSWSGSRVWSGAAVGVRDPSLGPGVWGRSSAGFGLGELLVRRCRLRELSLGGPPVAPSPWPPTHYLLGGAGDGEDSGLIVRLPLAAFPLHFLQGAGPGGRMESVGLVLLRARRANFQVRGRGEGVTGRELLFIRFFSRLMIPPHHPQEGMLRALALTAERPPFKVSIRLCSLT